MSQVTATSTTPPVTVVFTGASTTAVAVTIASTSLRLGAASFQIDVALLPFLILMDTVGDGFTGKVLTLTHFPLEPGCEDYSFSGPSCCRHWARSWFHPHWLCWDTGSWCIHLWAWCHCFFSLFRVPMLC